MGAIVLLLALWLLGSVLGDYLPCAYVQRTRAAGFSPGWAFFFYSKMNKHNGTRRRICLIDNGEVCWPNNMYYQNSAELNNFNEAGIVPNNYDNPVFVESNHGSTDEHEIEGRSKSQEFEEKGVITLNNEDYFKHVKSISCRSGTCEMTNKCSLGPPRGDRESIDVDLIMKAQDGHRLVSGADSFQTSSTLLILLIPYLALA